MRKEQAWTEDSRSDLRDTLRAVVLGELRLARNDHDAILSICREVYIEDDCPETEWDSLTRLATEELERSAAKLASQRLSWPSETDCDRLDRVEVDLRDQGILLWQVSPCCDTCTGAELPDRIDALERRHPGFRGRVRGYAFFIDQNMAEELADTTELSVYLAYGWFSPDDSSVAPEEYEEKALGVAGEVCASLKKHGFQVDWDGEFSRKIGVSLNWQRRDLLE